MAIKLTWKNLYVIIKFVEQLLNERCMYYFMVNKRNMREAQAAETRSKLLESATSLFAEKGYRGISVREISRNVNLADGILYHYFPGGKKEIFREVVETNVKKIINETEEKNPIEKYILMPLEVALEHYYDSFMEVIDNNIDIIRLLFRPDEISEIVTEEKLLRIVGTNDSYIKTLLIKKYELGEVRDMDFEMADMTVKDVIVKYTISKVFGITHGVENMEEMKKRIIAYQVSLWKN